jgi:hypothetical protein
VRQLGVLGFSAALIVEHDIVLLIGPIQAHKSREHGSVGRQVGRRGNHHEVLQQEKKSDLTQTRWLWFGEVLIDRRILMAVIV